MSIGKLAAMGIESQLTSGKLDGETPDALANLMKNVPLAIEQVVDGEPKSQEDILSEELQKKGVLPEGMAVKMVADNSNDRHYTAAEIVVLDAKIRAISFEKIYSDAHIAVNRVLDPAYGAYRKVPGKKRSIEAKREALVNYLKQAGYETNMEGKDIPEIVDASLDEYKETYEEKLSEADLKTGLILLVKEDFIPVINH